MLSDPPKMQYKVVLLGEPGVGKTSLIRRYVHGSYSEAYLATVGTSVSKRNEQLSVEEGRSFDVSLIIWDIMGKKMILDLMGEAYLFGAKGAIAVFDLTRKPTLQNLKVWIDAAREQNPRIPIIVLGNKADLEKRRVVTDRQAKNFCKPLGLTYMPTSAKKGLNVEAAFKTVALEALRTFASVEVQSGTD